MNVFLFIRLHLLSMSVLTFIVGIICSQYFLFPRSIFYYLVPTTSLFLFVFYKRIEGLSLLFIFFLFFQIGLSAGNLIQKPPTDISHILNIVENSTEKETVVIGKVVRIYGFNGETSKIDIESMSLRTQTSTYRKARGKIRYTLKGKFPTSILPGNTLAIRGKLKPPGKYLTPGSFDYQKHLSLDDIWLTGYIPSQLYIQKVHIRDSFTQKSLYQIELLREKIKNFIDAHLREENAALYKALITGDRSSISIDVIEQFKGAGCMHILAISGLHISLLAVFLFASFFWLLRRSVFLINRINTKKTAAILCIIPLTIYALLAGSHTPVIRSLIMSIVVIIAICTERKHIIYPLITLAAFLILVVSPAELFSPSFQLTFSAVLSIVATTPIISRFFSFKSQSQNLLKRITARACCWLIGALIISLAATLGTLPLLLYYFNRVSLIGPLANIIVEPLICLWSLPLGFLASIFINVEPSIALFLLKFGSLGLSLATKSVYFFNSFTFSSILLATPSLFQIVIYYLFFALFLRSFSLPRNVFYLSLSGIIISLMFFLIPLNELLKHRRDHSTLSILDVGHGSSALIEIPGGRRVLIDGGAISSPKFNIGERVIAPFLWNKGITTIDEIIVTHPDSDHYNGIPYIIENFAVQKLWINGNEEQAKTWQRLLEKTRKKQIPILIPTKKTVVFRYYDAQITIIANTALAYNGNSLNGKNEESLIIKYEHGDFSALFPGDITKNIEKDLIDQGVMLNSNLLLAAHHGSTTSNSESFLQAVSPEYLAVSASAFKTKSFPSHDLIGLCDRLGIKLLQTGLHGTITISTTGKSYDVSTFAP